MRIDVDFHAAYRELEERMKALAEAQGDVFLPNPQPEGPVQYVLICMEPSLGRWARSADQARSKVEAGFRNFLFSIEDFILHLCARRYLCGPGGRYHMTDLSKGAMLVKRAGPARDERYDSWYRLLEDEINLVAAPDAGIVAVGKAVSGYLERRRFVRPFTRVIHYSGQAGRARMAGVVGREESFEAFRDSVSLEDFARHGEGRPQISSGPRGDSRRDAITIAEEQTYHFTSAAHLQLQDGIRIDAIVRFSRPRGAARTSRDDGGSLG